MKDKVLNGKSVAMCKFDAFVEYQTKEQKEMRMIVDLIREIKIDIIIEEKKALKC